MLIYAQNSHSFLHLLVITCITIQSISVLYDTNNKLLLLFIVCFYLIAPLKYSLCLSGLSKRQLSFPDYQIQYVHTVQLKTC